MSVTAPPLDSYRVDVWKWDGIDTRGQPVSLDETGRTVYFRSFLDCRSERNVAPVRGTRVLNGGRFYWDIRYTASWEEDSAYAFFGVGTQKAGTQKSGLLGGDEYSWGLSTYGTAWHKGRCYSYRRFLFEKKKYTLGLLFDGVRGTLSYYEDGVCRGTAFTGLEAVEDDLYPMILSRSTCEMTLGTTVCEFVNLRDRCKAVVAKRVKTVTDIGQLNVPKTIEEALTKEAEWLVSKGSSHGLDEPINGVTFLYYFSP